MPTIDYYFTMASPWAYLGHVPFLALARRHHLTVRYKPVPLGEVFPETGGLPLAKRHPARQRYRLVELQRWRDRRGVPLRPNSRGFPFNPSLADRAILALIARGRDPDSFMRRVFQGIWLEERNLAEEETLAELLLAEAVEPKPLLDLAGSEEVRGRYDANAREAIAADVFGSPSYVREGEVFWGQDRLDLLEEAVVSGRPPYTPATA